MSKQHLDYLQCAMEQAEKAHNTQTYPIGAVIVDPKGNIIGQGYNHVYSAGDYTSHAEMEAIRDAGSRLMQEPNFEASTLYTTMEPCLMCCGAILLARIKRVVWVIDDEQYGALRYLYSHSHSLDALTEMKAVEVEFFEDCAAGRNSTQPASDCPGEPLPAFAGLPTGYAEKIAKLSILPAGDSHLASRMSSWMTEWNAMKEGVLMLRKCGLECRDKG